MPPPAARAAWHTLDQLTHSDEMLLIVLFSIGAAVCVVYILTHRAAEPSEPKPAPPMPVMPTDYNDLRGAIRFAAEMANKYEREIADSGHNYHVRAQVEYRRGGKASWEQVLKKSDSDRKSDNHKRATAIEDLKLWIERFNEPSFLPEGLPCTLAILHEALWQASHTYGPHGQIKEPASYTVPEEYAGRSTGYDKPSIFKQLEAFYEAKRKNEVGSLTKRRDAFVRELTGRLPQLRQAELEAMLTTYTAQLATEAKRTSPANAEYSDSYCATVRTVITAVKTHLPPELPVVRIASNRHGFTTFRLLPAADENTSLDSMRQLFSAVSASRLPEIEFALAATSEEIYLLVHLATSAAETFETLLHNSFPKAVLEVQDPAALPQTCTAHDRYRLNTAYCPITTFTDFNQNDPYAAFCAGMQTTLGPGDFALVSIRFGPPPPVLFDFSQTIRAAYEEAQKKKHGPPMWAVAVETFISAAPTQSIREAQRAAVIREAIERHLLARFQSPAGYFVRLTDSQQRELYKANYFFIEKIFEVDPALLGRTVLSTDELAGLVHLPHKTITSPLLQRANMIDQKPPDFVTGPDGLLLGTCPWRRQNIEIRLPQHVRSRHMYTLGASGSGKSTLLLNMIVQDMTSGAGLAVIDPHGDLIAKTLPHIPKARIGDVIFFNAADYDHPIALNPLQARTRREQEQVRDEFMALFTRLFVSGDAPRMLHILRFTITTLIQAGNKTFFDIRRLLINSEFRRGVLSTITDPHVLEFWQQEFPSFPKSATDPIVNKLSQFTLSTTVHNILAQAKSQINFYDLMQERKIFLASLPPDIGEENAHLLGSLIVAQIQMAAMRRSAIPEQQRVPFTLYVDEFQNFMSSGFEKILSEARKYQLSLVLAHQYITQLQDNVRAAIFANTHTRVFFQVSPQDANTVRTLLGTATPEQLVSFPRGQALVTMPACNPFMLRTFPDPPQPAHNFIQQITDASRQRYSSRPEPAVAPTPDLNTSPQPTSEASEPPPAAATFARVRPPRRKPAALQPAAKPPADVPADEATAKSRASATDSQGFFDELFKNQ